MTPLYKNQAFAISHADGSGDGTPLKGAGLRPFLECRHLGIKEATKGAYAAHAIRAVPGRESPAAPALSRGLDNPRAAFRSSRSRIKSGAASR